MNISFKVLHIACFVCPTSLKTTERTPAHYLAYCRFIYLQCSSLSDLYRVYGQLIASPYIYTYIGTASIISNQRNTALAMTDDGMTILNYLRSMHPRTRQKTALGRLQNERI